MEVAHDMPVIVRRRHGDKSRATYRASDITGLHMGETDDATGARGTGLQGYVWCDAMLEGSIGDMCGAGAGAHRLRVCVQEKDNPKHVYQALVARIGEAA